MPDVGVDRPYAICFASFGPSRQIQRVIRAGRWWTLLSSIFAVDYLSRLHLPYLPTSNTNARELLQWPQLEFPSQSPHCITTLPPWTVIPPYIPAPPPPVHHSSRFFPLFFCYYCSTPPMPGEHIHDECCCQ